MPRIARLAITTIQAEADSHVLSWALLELLNRAGLQPQHFFSRACFPAVDNAANCTGLRSRHLDSWLMSPDVCREVFVKGCHGSDIALVEGRLVCSRKALVEPQGGCLRTLCHWLHLPLVAVVDASLLNSCCLPQRPQADALLLDRVADRHEFFRLQTLLESLWGIPVVGALEKLPALRQMLAHKDLDPELAADVGHQLGSHLAPYADLAQLLRLAGNCPPLEISPRLFRRCISGNHVTVAVAFDEAFHGYFPDALDLLEARGARVVDFSPLHDESVPAGSDVVYLGCGQPQRFARRLADNHCMLTSLRSHISAGRRIYAEGGGAAYLCHMVETPDGQRCPMVGALPAVAKWNDTARPAQPVELTMATPSWLGGIGARLRGYVRSDWQMEPLGNLAGFVAERGHERDVCGRRRAVGSRMHLNLAAQPDLLHRFVRP